MPSKRSFEALTEAWLPLFAVSDGLLYRLIDFNRVKKSLDLVICMTVGLYAVSSDEEQKLSKYDSESVDAR